MLYYHKCDDCLTPFSSIEQHIDECDCGGAVTFMGVVHGDHYEKVENRPACDGRCTHASGPHCDCQCGGINHGTGRVVATVVKEGKVKVVDPTADIYDEMVRGYKFRELKDKAEELFATAFNGVPAYDRARMVARTELTHALRLRVYDRREKAILDFVLKYLKQFPKQEN